MYRSAPEGRLSPDDRNMLDIADLPGQGDGKDQEKTSRAAGVVASGKCDTIPAINNDAGGNEAVMSVASSNPVAPASDC